MPSLSGSGGAGGAAGPANATATLNAGQTVGGLQFGNINTGSGEATASASSGISITWLIIGGIVAAILFLKYGRRRGQ